MESTPTLKAHVKREFPSFRDLEAGADAVESLAGHAGWAVVCRILDAEVQHLDDALDERLHEHADYARLHGRRGGVKLAAGIITAVRNRFATELEEQRKKHEPAAETAERS